MYYYIKIEILWKKFEICVGLKKFQTLLNVLKSRLKFSKFVKCIEIWINVLKIFKFSKNLKSGLKKVLKSVRY